MNCKSENGAATIFEYVIVLPVVLGIVFMLIFVGFTMHQEAVMESATQRAALYISRTITDPSYENIVTTDSANDSNDIVSAKITKESIVNKPYRYLFAGSGQMSDYEDMVSALIKRNQIFIDKEPVVVVKKEAGIFTKVIVTATQQFEIPKLVKAINLPPFLTIETESVVYVNEPSEFIRNADFIIEKIVEIGETTGIIDKVKSVISKVSFFNSNVK